MGHKDMSYTNISHNNKEIRDQVLEENNKKSKNYHDYNDYNECCEIECKDETDFCRRKSLNEDFLCFNVTVEGKYGMTCSLNNYEPVKLNI